MRRLAGAPFVLVTEGWNLKTGLGSRFGSQLLQVGFKGRYNHLVYIEKDVAGCGSRWGIRDWIRPVFRRLSKRSSDPDLKPLAATQPGRTLRYALAPRARRGAALVVTCLALGGFAAIPVRAADPQSYKVRLEGEVAGDIDSTLNASSDLVTLRKSAPVSPLAWSCARAAIRYD